MYKPEHWDSFVELVSDLLYTDSVRTMHGIMHHGNISCYEHSIFVGYTAYRMAVRFGADCRAAARGGLLHDLYLYDWRDATQYEGPQCFAHPKAALKNARALSELSRKEENIILSHMWPLSRTMPHSREAVLVSLADKYCATLEGLHIWHNMKMRAGVRKATATQY